MKVFLIDGNEDERVMELTKGKGAEAVIDFVGEHGSTKMGLRHDRQVVDFITLLATERK